MGFFKELIVSNYDGANSAFPVDMDKDGDVDIVGCANSADRITWWENNRVNFLQDMILIRHSTAHTASSQ